MTGRAPLLLLTALLALAGCERYDRFVGPPTATSIPDSVTAKYPAGQKVAVCYRDGKTSTEQVVSTATELCTEPGSTVRYLASDYYLNECPLLKKRRAVFMCIEP